MTKRRMIDTDGNVTKLPRPLSLLEIADLIRAEFLDSFPLPGGERMYLDDDGHAKGLAVNAEATILYRSICQPGTTHGIVGDVVIVPDADVRR